MKMNSLDALVDVLAQCEAGGTKSVKALEPFLPPRREVKLASGRPVGEVGSTPIRHMRALMQGSKLSDELVNDILSRGQGEERVASVAGKAA